MQDFVPPSAIERMKNLSTYLRNLIQYMVFAYKNYDNVKTCLVTVIEFDGFGKQSYYDHSLFNPNYWLWFKKKLALLDTIFLHIQL